MASFTQLRVPKRHEKQRSFASRSADLFVLVLGVTTMFSVHLIGELYLAEILLLGAFPVLAILRARRLLRPELKPLFALMAVWLVGQVVSDAYNHIDITDRMRGVALIVFFAINLLGMSVLLGHNERRKVLYLMGLMVGALAAVKLQPSPAAEEYPWKFGYAWGTIQLVMLVSSYLYSRRRYMLSALLVLGICGVNVIMNFRSPILQLLITIALVYPFIPDQVGAVRILPHSQGLRLLVLVMFAVGAAGTANELVKFATTGGFLGERAQAKNEAQAKAGNLILGGRPEFVVGLRAALDRPIMGHGSWARDLKYFEMLYDLTVETGVQEEQAGGDIARASAGVIPGHSHIVTAWVWAGIAGLIFWAYMIWFVLRAIAQIAVQRPSLAPVYMWFLLSLLWDIFFSPFAANRRVVEAALIVIIADVMTNRVTLTRPAWRRMGATRHGISPHNGGGLATTGRQ